jgi:ribosomal protein S18 acetylase RimI-like enzyme
MTRTDILGRYDREARTRTNGRAPGFHVEWDGPVLRMTGPDATPSANAVLFAQLDEASADKAIARQVAFFATAGRSFEWKHFSHDRPADLPARLSAAGFKATEPETFVALDLSRQVVDSVPKGVEIRRLEDPAAFDAITAVNEAVYGDADHASWLARVIGDEKRADPDCISVYAAYADKAPVSVGWMRYRQGDAFGSLWGGATLAEYRGKGIYTAMVAERVKEARQRGGRWLTVDCSAMSLPILERRGFQKLAVITPFIWSRPG